MKQDLEHLMEKNDIDALWISGPAQHNPAMVYMTGGFHVTNADLFVMRGRTPILVHDPMEREEAAKSGFQLINTSQYDFKSLLKEASEDLNSALALRYQLILNEIGLRQGKVKLYGTREVGNFFTVLSKLQGLIPALEFSGDSSGAILLQARATKDALELERIRRMGQLTTTVVGRTADFLSSHQAKDEVLIKSDGSPLTIKDVKRLINLWTAELGGENPEDTIFAIGRDAGVPHSSGNPTDPIRLGQTIVYDIFPCESGGGYFYDFTRTWSLGYATDEVYRLYEQVKHVYDIISSEVQTGINVQTYQDRTCQLFEKMGHETVRQNPCVVNGYVHSLGHGVGLNVHEKPFCGQPKNDTQILRPGSVFTLEPGLYYPDRGMGVRLEDTWYVTEKGDLNKVVDYSMDLVLPVKGVG